MLYIKQLESPCTLYTSLVRCVLVLIGVHSIHAALLKGLLYIDGVYDTAADY